MSSPNSRTRNERLILLNTSAWDRDILFLYLPFKNQGNHPEFLEANALWSDSNTNAKLLNPMNLSKKLSSYDLKAL
jgi:hypothetical protein